MDAHAFVSHLEDVGGAALDLDGEHVSLSRAEVDVRVEGREGYSIAEDSHYGVAIDVELTEDLIAEGAAREVVRGVQDLRRSSGLAVEDRIALWVETDRRALLERHSELIAEEVLAEKVEWSDGAPEGAFEATIEIDGASLRVALTKA